MPPTGPTFSPAQHRYRGTTHSHPHPCPVKHHLSGIHLLQDQCPPPHKAHHRRTTHSLSRPRPAEHHPSEAHQLQDQHLSPPSTAVEEQRTDPHAHTPLRTISTTHTAYRPDALPRTKPISEGQRTVSCSHTPMTATSARHISYEVSTLTRPAPSSKDNAQPLTTTPC